MPLVHPAALQTQIAQLHAWERDALVAGDVDLARELAAQKFTALSQLEHLTQSN